MADAVVHILAVGRVGRRVVWICTGAAMCTPDELPRSTTRLTEHIKHVTCASCLDDYGAAGEYAWGRDG